MGMVEGEWVLQDCECAAAHMALRTSQPVKRMQGKGLHRGPKT